MTSTLYSNVIWGPNYLLSVLTPVLLILLLASVTLGSKKKNL